MIQPNEAGRNGRVPFEALRVPKAAELVAASIRREIVRGELREGDGLPSEGELMAQFGVSRPTLREALRVLESELLISVHRGSRGGARVHTPDPTVAATYAGLVLQVEGTTVEDVLNTRLVLEVGAVRTLAEQGVTASVAELEATLAAEEDALDDLNRFTEAASKFHREIVEATGSNSLMLLTRMLEDITARHSAAVKAAEPSVPTRRPAWRTKTHEVHAAVLQLVREGKTSEAEHLWRAHLRETGRAMVMRAGARTVLDLFE
jgi:DNA-binding FadR family transcriptional regulator